MTAQPQTERVLHDFVRDAVSHLCEALKDSVPEFENDIRWECGPDGHFRVHTRCMRILGRKLSDEWLASLPDYQACVECLQADANVRPHLDRMVGTSHSTHRIMANSILKSLVYAMFDDEGALAFTDERFRSKWEKLVGFFGADQIPFKTVAPLPHLVAPAFPLRLNNELVLDRLTESEVTRCYQAGVIRPDSLQFPLIYGQVTVGIRRTVFLPKLIRRGDEPPEPLEAEGEGSFGNRPLSRGDLVIDDVLSALRLFKNTQIRAAGFTIGTDSPWLSGTTSYQVLGRWPYCRGFELSENDVPQFLALWHLLEQRATNFRFSIHRFNLAFDRGLLADRIVDLVIAAEALFLSDIGNEPYRGELGYRLALRAAKFIEHQNYVEHGIFRLMRRAYIARSAIVHGGGLPRDTGLPDNPSAELSIFIDAIEELVRLGLRKALSMNENMRQAEFWDALIFSKPNSFPHC